MSLIATDAVVSALPWCGAAAGSSAVIYRLMCHALSADALRHPQPLPSRSSPCLVKAPSTPSDIR